MFFQKKIEITNIEIPSKFNLLGGNMIFFYQTLYAIALNKNIPVLLKNCETICTPVELEPNLIVSLNNNMIAYNKNLVVVCKNIKINKLNTLCFIDNTYKKKLVLPDNYEIIPNTAIAVSKANFLIVTARDSNNKSCFLKYSNNNEDKKYQWIKLKTPESWYPAIPKHTFPNFVNYNTIQFHEGLQLQLQNKDNRRLFAYKDSGENLDNDDFYLWNGKNIDSSEITDNYYISKNDTTIILNLNNNDNSTFYYHVPKTKNKKFIKIFPKETFQIAPQFLFFEYSNNTNLFVAIVNTKPILSMLKFVNKKYQLDFLDFSEINNVLPYTVPTASTDCFYWVIRNNNGGNKLIKVKL